MPQMGQAPGSVRTIWGCIGQVYSVRAACGISGSRAMPQEGHGPGLGSRTSGHIGQTKAGAAGAGFRLGVGAGATPPRLTNCEGGGLGPGDGRTAPAAFASFCGAAFNFFL